MEDKQRVLREGGVREMLAIALPMVISHACDTVMIFTDRLFMARLDPELMNAVMGGGLASFLLNSFFIGLIGFTTALVAQYLGAKKKSSCGVVLTQAMIIAVIAYPLIILMRPLAYWLFRVLGVGPGQIGPQTAYFNILIYGAIIGLLRIALSSFFSGIGRTRIVMIASISTMLANVGLNYVLIYGKFGVPAMGIRGAAYGTVLGGVLGLLILVWAYLRGNNRKEFNLDRSFRFDRGVFAKLMHFGSPAGLEMCLNIFAFNAIVTMFHSRGPIIATAATVVFNWDLVSFVPLIGIEIGVTSLVGRFMGEGKPDKAHQAVMSGLRIGLVYSLLIFLLFIGFTGKLVNLFRPMEAGVIFAQAVPTAVTMVRIASVYVLVEAVLCVFIGALRGAGDTHWAMRISVTLHWMMAVVLAVILRFLHLSPAAGWAAMVFLFLVFSGLVFLRYREGKWRSMRIVEPVIIPEEGFIE